MHILLPLSSVPFRFPNPFRLPFEARVYSNVLMCHTDLMSCCRVKDIHQGHWYSPTDQKLPKQRDDDRFLYVKRLVKRVDLKKR